MEHWIECPDCGLQLLIDGETGSVLSQRKRKTGKGGERSLEGMLSVERDRQKAAEERFAQACHEEKHKEQHAERRFREALKRAEENPDQKPPLRDVALD